jgi:hypothetical protein
MNEQCKREGHDWGDGWAKGWDLYFDKRRGKIWMRKCIRCGEVEENIETPIEVTRAILRRQQGDRRVLMR